MQAKPRKVRVHSARVSSAQNQTPVSGSERASQLFNKKQFVQNAYGAPTRINVKSHNAKYNSSGNDHDKVYNRPLSKTLREKQEMAEEILMLKQKINKLVSELTIQKGKTEAMRKKTTKYSKLLDVQFQDDKQWGSTVVSSHLVSGIKNMYENLKQKFQQKCQQYDELACRIQSTDYFQLKTYIQTLEDINREIQHKLEVIATNHLEFSNPNQTQKQATILLISQLALQNEKLEEKCRQYDRKCKSGDEIMGKFQIKLKFLQKLIIQKDNNNHALQRRIKQLSALIQKLKEQLTISYKTNQDLQTSIQNQKQNSTRVAKQMEDKCNNEIQVMRKQCQQRIAFVKSKNNFIQGMLAQIKKNNTELNKQLQEMKEKNLKQAKLQKQQRQFNLRMKENRIEAGLQQNNLFYNQKPIPSPSTNQNSRVQKRADKKQSQHSLKKRKVHEGEVQQIAQLIRFRLIYARVFIEDLRNLFDYKALSGKSIKKQDQEWQKQYINTKQTIQILTKGPLNLQSQTAIVFARYLIEDVQEQYVYYDNENENHREVVKAILKTIIKEYPVHIGSKITDETCTIMHHYGQNLKQTLKVLEPTGLITKAKFFENLNNLGIEASMEVKEYLVAKMATNSQNINKLSYLLLF